MIENMITIMIQSEDYPKTRLNKILAENSGDILGYEVSMLFAEWTLNMKIPEIKNKYYTNKDNGGWQSWIQLQNTQ